MPKIVSKRIQVNLPVKIAYAFVRGIYRNLATEKKNFGTQKATQMKENNIVENQHITINLSRALWSWKISFDFIEIDNVQTDVGITVSLPWGLTPIFHWNANHEAIIWGLESQLRNIEELYKMIKE